MCGQQEQGRLSLPFEDTPTLLSTPPAATPCWFLFWPQQLSKNNI
jgi:hypothetical protein